MHVYKTEYILIFYIWPRVTIMYIGRAVA